MTQTNTTLNVQSNFILAALPTHFYQQQLIQHLQPCLFHTGSNLFDTRDEVQYVYFPKNGLISLVIDAKDGVNVEVGVVGREGAVGVGEVLTGIKMVTRAQVQMAGSGWRLPADIMRQNYKSAGAFQDIIMRYQQSLATQAAHGALCNRRHSIEQRLSRWLLMAHDRIQGDTLELTHEFLANMLGTRRAAVSITANHLRSEGLIEYTRGSLSVVNRDGLEQVACECYAPLREQFEFLKQQGENVKQVSPSMLQLQPVPAQRQRVLV